MKVPISDYSLSPFWHDDIDFSGLSEHPENLPNKAEVLIVGAGLTGLSAALTLARAGKQVVLVDSEQVGAGASTRNGGLLGPSFHKLGLEGMINKWGVETANLVMRESMAGFHWLLEFIETEKIDCQLSRRGRFRGALQERHFIALQKQAEVIAQVLDYPISVIDKAQQHKEVGSNCYHGGVVYHQDAMLHPARLVRALCYRVEKAGTRIFCPAKVTAVNKTFSGFDVTIGEQEIQVQAVLIATNGYTDNNFPYLQRRILPIRSAMIATQALPESLIRSVSPKLRSHGGTDRLVYYYRPSPDGKRMLFGGRALSYKDSPKEYAGFLFKNMTRLFPQLAEAKISHAWSGLVAYTFDHIPHLGKHDGMYYAMGYCGSGVARATYLGDKVAQKMLQTGGETPFDKFSFDSRFMYNGRPWFLPMLLRWHSLADKMGW